MDTKQVFTALVKAQRAFGPALKDKTNPAFRSKYADLGACLDAVMDALNEQGIALVQKQHPHEGGVCVETVFVHESGESYSAGLLTVPASKQDPQGYGSALTYARRYSVMAACGIAPEDDDGNAASKPKPTAAPRKVLTSPDPNTGDVAWVNDDPAPMPPAELARWLDLIRTCEPHMVADTARKAGEAAKTAEDLEAYHAMRQAKLARVAALKTMAGTPAKTEAA